MSRANVERTREVIDAFNRRDLRAYLALTHPDVEFTPYEVYIEGGDAYRGHAGVRTWWEDALAVIPNLRAEVDEMRDFGDRTFVRGCLRGDGAGSGAPIERSMWLVAEWHDGQEVWWCAFASEQEALEAAALPQRKPRGSA